VIDLTELLEECSRADSPAAGSPAAGSPAAGSPVAGMPAGERLAAVERRIVRRRRRLFGMCGQQRFDGKDVVRVGVFQRWRGLHWRSLALSNVTRNGRRALLCGVENPRKPVSKPHTASAV